MATTRPRPRDSAASPSPSPSAASAVPLAPPACSSPRGRLAALQPWPSSRGEHPGLPAGWTYTDCSSRSWRRVSTSSASRTIATRSTVRSTPAWSIRSRARSTAWRCGSRSVARWRSRWVSGPGSSRTPTGGGIRTPGATPGWWARRSPRTRGSARPTSVTRPGRSWSVPIRSEVLTRRSSGWSSPRPSVIPPLAADRRHAPAAGVRDAGASGRAPPQPDVPKLADAFRLGLRELARRSGTEVLPAERSSSWGGRGRTPRRRSASRIGSGRVWVYDFAVAHSVRSVERQQLLRSMTPLYLGWVASFTNELHGLDAAAAEERVERLCRAFESGKRYLVGRWRWPETFAP